MKSVTPDDLTMFPDIRKDTSQSMKFKISLRYTFLSNILKILSTNVVLHLF